MKTQRRLNKVEMLEEAKQAAYLRSCGLTVEQIVRYMDSSLTTISRRLELARNSKILSEKYIVHLKPEEIEKLELLNLEQELSEALAKKMGSHFVQRTTIVPSEKGKEDENIKRVGDAAALRLFQHMNSGKMKTVGVSWGRTVAATAQAARRLSPTVEPYVDTQVEFIPIVGDLLLPTKMKIYQFSASTIAAELTRAFKGNLQDQHDLSIPACFPEDFFQGSPDKISTEKRLIRRFLETLPSYQAVFGARAGESNQKPVIQCLDTLISGCGFIQSSGRAIPVKSRKDSMWFNLTRHIQDSERERLRKAASGDLCSRLVPHQDADEEGRKLVEEINERVFAAPTSDDIRLCKDRSRKDDTGEQDTPGVIIVASGAEKARVLLNICFGDLVSEIVIDKELAIGMAQLLRIDLRGFGIVQG